jgi:two-component system sensor histidine kinase FlrB
MGLSLSGQLKGLEQSFETFNQLSESLETTYHRLEDRVSQLNSQLDEIQQQRRAENDEYDRVSQRYYSVLSALPAGVVVLDTHGQVQECNPAAIDMLGSPLRGELWRDVVVRSFAPRSDDGHDISLQNGRRVNLSTCPLGNDPGQVLLFNDVTETRQLQQRLNQQQRLIAMGEMAAGVAHQIRTPLASAMLYGSQLKSHRLEEGKRGELLDKMLQRIRHLEGLVNDMLLFSKTGYTGSEEIHIAALLHNLAEELEQHCRASNTTLNITIESDESGDAEQAIVVGNPSILQSAISNLANNALQAMGEGGRLDILLRSQQLGTVDVCIYDTGPGISPEVQAKIFDPFFTTRTQGTGLGLPVVQAIARAHQGEVWLESSSAAGSAFVIRLPVAQASQPLAGTSQHAAVTEPD